MCLKSLQISYTDISNSLKQFHLAALLGWQDVRQRYRRSVLGPFWLTVSMGVMIGTIGVVFGQIFNSPMQDFLPFLSIGLVLWNFISNTLTEGCVGFISSEAIIKQLPIPLFIHILRLIWRNIIIMTHNIVIFPIVLIIYHKEISWIPLISIPGFFLLLLNLIWMVLFLSVLCARYRDLPQIVTSLLLVMFYLTPIMWMPSLLPQQNTNVKLLILNPFFHLMEIVKAPLLGNLPSILNWKVSIMLGVFGWLVTMFMYGHYKRRIAYWL